MPAHGGSWLTLPNLISGLRFVVAPAMLCVAWTGRASVFLALLALSFLSDCLDGYLARKLNQTSELGSILDTGGDLVSFAVVPLCGWWLWPDRVRPEAPFVLALAISYACPIVLGFLKFGRLTNYHTWGGRLSAVLLAVAALVLVGGGSPLAFHLAVAVVVLADLEEIAITTLLPQWQPSVASLWHARRNST